MKNLDSMVLAEKLKTVANGVVNAEKLNGGEFYTTVAKGINAPAFHNVDSSIEVWCDPKRYKVCIHTRYFEGFSDDELATCFTDCKYSYHEKWKNKHCFSVVRADEATLEKFLFQFIGLLRFAYRTADTWEVKTPVPLALTAVEGAAEGAAEVEKPAPKKRSRSRKKDKTA